jgi:hypothetical protein
MFPIFLINVCIQPACNNDGWDIHLSQRLCQPVSIREYPELIKGMNFVKTMWCPGPAFF